MTCSDTSNTLYNTTVGKSCTKSVTTIGGMLYHKHVVFRRSLMRFQANVDVETRLHNTIFPLQACPQAKYFPGTSSDMYNSQYLTHTNKPVHMTNQLLFNQERFNSFNPNMCNTGYKLFNNNRECRASPRSFR